MDLDKWFDENPDWRPFADLVAVPPLAEELMKEYTDVSSEVLARCMEPVWENGGNITRGAVYVRVRREDKKCNDRWATMLCLNAPPGIQTTDTFWRGRDPWYKVYGDPEKPANNTYVNDVKRELARRGVNLKPGDEYMPELARFKGDPEAVVPFGGARSYIKQLCEKRGWACEGAVTVKHREPECDLLADENCVPLADDIIRRKSREMVQSDPKLKKLNRKELRQAVLDKHGPSKTKARKTLLD